MWSLLDLRKYLSNKLRNVLATLVVTFLLKRGLNQIMLRLCFCCGVFCSFLSNFNSVLWYPLFFKAVSYSDFDSFKISSLDEFLFNLLLIDISRCLMTWGGWLEDVLTYNKKSLSFLYGRYVWFVKSNVRSKLSTVLKLVLISILNPTF